MVPVQVNRTNQQLGPSALRRPAPEVLEPARPDASRGCHVRLPGHRWIWIPPRKSRDSNVFREFQSFQQPDAVVIGVELIPRKTMPSRNWIGMVIVVPALAPRKQRYPPAVARLVPGCEASATVEVRRGIHQPCGVGDQASRPAPRLPGQCSDVAETGICNSGDGPLL